MKRIISIVTFIFFVCLSHAQKVSNIRAEQRGHDIVVFYSLEATSPCEVSLLLSQDNGLTWSAPLKNVSGDVGKKISAGEKQIIWKVLDEKAQLVGSDIRFKVSCTRTFSAGPKKSFEPELVYVEGGRFLMGSDSVGNSEKPIHPVILSSYFIAKYEVTQSQWYEVMGSNPSYFGGCDNCPVEHISWNDVKKYLTQLNLKSGRNYRLPTEAEWEFAARGGVESLGFVFSGSNDINQVGWNLANSGKRTNQVGLKIPNELGIYDMTGNVEEYCSDWFYPRYNNFEEVNPCGIFNETWKEDRIVRGGGFWNTEENSRATTRYSRNFDGFGLSLGFRLVLPVGN